MTDNREKLRERLKELEAQIEAYPYWGAALTAMDEERRGILRALADHGEEPSR